MGMMTDIVDQHTMYKETAQPNAQRRSDKEGNKHTEHIVEVAEKNSRHYVVRGASTMAGAIEHVLHNGYDSGTTEGVSVEELDGSFYGEKIYAPKPVMTNKYSACHFKGRCFDNPTPIGLVLYPYIYCTSYLDGHAGGVCIQCETALEKGWVLRPKEND
jgi:hypothetical protein